MEILGLLDTLESMIVEGFRIPMTKKTIIDEEKVLKVLDKTRLVVQGGGGHVKNAIDKRPVPPKQESMDFVEARKDLQKAKEMLPMTSDGDDKATEIIESAYKIAKEVRMGADKYADEVLSNLEATSSRILRSVKAGRTRLGKFIAAAPQESGEEKK